MSFYIENTFKAIEEQVMVMAFNMDTRLKMVITSDSSLSIV